MKGKKPPATANVIIEDWFKDIGLDNESTRKEPDTEKPPSKKRKIVS